MFRFLLAAAAALRFVCMTQAGFAGTISSYTLPSGAVVPVNTQVVNNFPVTLPNPNVLSLQGTSDPALIFNSFGPVDIDFSKQQPVGVTTYIVHESVVNQTGVDWNGFWIQIGFDTGFGFRGDQTGNVNGTITCFSAFSPAPTASAFTVLGGTPSSTLKWSAGTVPAGGKADFSFSIEVSEQPTFILRQFPIAVPEPATIVLVAVGAAGLLIASLRF